jgi:hypothetical protein
MQSLDGKPVLATMLPVLDMVVLVLVDGETG